MSRLYICTIIILVSLIIYIEKQAYQDTGQLIPPPISQTEKYPLSREDIRDWICKYTQGENIYLPTEDVNLEWKTIRYLPVEDKIKYLHRLYESLQDKIPQFPKFIRPGLAHNHKGEHDSIPERYTVEYMEKLFYPEKFHTRKYVSWIRNPLTKRPLQIDGYSENLRIGVEYNGAQHYKWPNYFSMNKEEFINQVYRDGIKRSTCKQCAFFLIIIPYTVSLMDIPYYIYLSLLQAAQEVIQINEKNILAI